MRLSDVVDAARKFRSSDRNLMIEVSLVSRDGAKSVALRLKNRKTGRRDSIEDAYILGLDAVACWSDESVVELLDAIIEEFSEPGRRINNARSFSRLTLDNVPPVIM